MEIQKQPLHLLHCWSVGSPRRHRPQLHDHIRPSLGHYTVDLSSLTTISLDLPEQAIVHQPRTTCQLEVAFAAIVRANHAKCTPSISICASCYAAPSTGAPGRKRQRFLHCRRPSFLTSPKAITHIGGAHSSEPHGLISTLFMQIVP